MSNPHFKGVLEGLLKSQDMAKGPYLSIKLPFQEGDSDNQDSSQQTSRDVFPDLSIPFSPYKHQLLAFHRLRSPKAQSTLVATGTGSGKTECFMYPILDHVYRHRHEKGVKAIIIYPMNALADDQATRLARLIWGDDDGFHGLRNQVTAGMYVGQKSRKPAAVMTKDSIITIRDSIRENPPDILLTNYKMLDYLLIRPKDKTIWEKNLPETLQYLVVDEFHTFDGAQGTDLACLIRRLKARLKARDDAIRDARQILLEKKGLLPYQSVVVDEAQDMGEQAFKLIRAIVGQEKSNDLFIAGDAHQRIYNRRVVLGRCGINIVGRSRKLRVNYRTTEETRRWSIALLKGIKIDDLDGGGDDHRGVRSLTHGDPPEICMFDNFQAEVAFLLERLSMLDLCELAATCVVARTNTLLSQYEGAFKAAGISVYHIKSSEAEDRKAQGIRMATMHRVKGLEFERMFIVGVNRGIVPLARQFWNEYDHVAKHEHLLRERALLYVAATRAKQRVVVSCFGEISQFCISK